MKKQSSCDEVWRAGTSWSASGRLGEGGGARKGTHDAGRGRQVVGEVAERRPDRTQHHLDALAALVGLGAWKRRQRIVVAGSARGGRGSGREGKARTEPNDGRHAAAGDGEEDAPTPERRGGKDGEVEAMVAADPAVERVRDRNDEVAEDDGRDRDAGGETGRDRGRCNLILTNSKGFRHPVSPERRGRGAGGEGEGGEGKARSVWLGAGATKERGPRTSGGTSPTNEGRPARASARAAGGLGAMSGGSASMSGRSKCTTRVEESWRRRQDLPPKAARPAALTSDGDDSTAEGGLPGPERR